MRERACKQCGKVFSVATGSNAYLCEDCSGQLRKDGVLRERVCKQCGASFVGYPRSFFCPECSAERKREQQRKHDRKNPKRPIGSIDICGSCGKEYTVNSGRQRYCPECAETKIVENIRKHKIKYMDTNKKKIQELKKETLGKRYICRICGKEFEKHTAAVTCSEECAREYKRRKQNEADIKRGKRKIPAEERYNSGLPKSGVVGVTWHKGCGKWQAKYQGKYMGLFDTVEEAAEEIEKHKNE